MRLEDVLPGSMSGRREKTRTRRYLKKMNGLTAKAFCLFAMICLMAVFGGCGESSREGTGPSGGKTGAQGEKQKAGDFSVPAEGTWGQRVQKLWEVTGPVMKTDASANLSDKEYQDKRAPLFSVWVTLQGKLSLAEPRDENAQRAIPEVLKFIDNLYGFPGFKQERREKDREIAKKYFEKRYNKLNEQIKALQ